MREFIKKLVPKPLILCYQKLRYSFIVLCFYIFRVLRVNKNKIVICNVWGYGDNSKYVMEELVRQNVPYELIFITNKPKQVPKIDGVRFLKTNSLLAIKALATAGVWVDNNRKEGYTRKRKNQYYIQLWHGGLALKKVEGDCASYLGEEYIKRAKRDSNMTDLYVSNGTFCTNMYRRAFWFQGEILECGTPRIDLLLRDNEEIKYEIKSKLGIHKNNKVALYAPTYREGGDTSDYLLQFGRIQKELERFYSSDVTIVIRLHPLVAASSKDFHYSDNIVNGSYYLDMYELMYVTDLLITDYSNTMFEFAMMKRPVILFAKDLKNYSDERGLYFDYNSLPFPIARSEEEIIEILQTYNLDLNLKRAEEFFHHVNLIETGIASKEVVRKINEFIEKR